MGSLQGNVMMPLTHAVNCIKRSDERLGCVQCTDQASIADKSQLEGRLKPAQLGPGKVLALLVFCGIGAMAKYGFYQAGKQSNALGCLSKQLD